MSNISLLVTLLLVSSLLLVGDVIIPEAEGWHTVGTYTSYYYWMPGHYYRWPYYYYPSVYVYRYSYYYGYCPSENLTGGYYGYYYSSGCTELTLTVKTNPDGAGKVMGTGKYNYGSTATIAAEKIVAKEDSRYVFTNWSGDISSSSPTETIRMDKTKTATANYKVQYALSVSANPPNVVALPEGGWLDADSMVNLGPLQETVNLNPDTRLVFDHWTVDGSKLDARSVSIKMNEPRDVVAHFRRQFLVTLNSPTGSPRGGGWYYEGTTARIDIEPAVRKGLGTMEVFERWTGTENIETPSSTVQVNGPVRLSAEWRTDQSQLFVTAAVTAAAILFVGLVAFSAREERLTVQSRTDQQPRREARRRAGSMLACSNCGTRVPKIAKFCSECGVKISQQ